MPENKSRRPHIFENADLLDWGLRKWPSRQLKTAGRKICRLFDLWQPTRLLIREAAPRREYEMAQEVARNAKVPVVDVRRAVVQDAFRSSNRLSRFDIAELISERYPNSTRVCLRNVNENEPFQLRMFDAAAVDMAFRSMSHRQANEV